MQNIIMMTDSTRVKLWKSFRSDFNAAKVIQGPRLGGLQNERLQPTLLRFDLKLHLCCSPFLGESKAENSSKLKKKKVR